MCARTIPGANDGGFRLPASDGYWAVVDGGGSFFGVVIFADNGALMVSTRVSTTGYSRVDDVVLDVFRSFGETHGVIPRRVVLALAGPIDKRRRTVTLLKNRDWAVFDLDEFCRKQNYRFARESWGSESDAWLRATELLAGKPEVFGNDIHRRKRGDSAIRGWGGILDRLRQWVSGGEK